MKSRLILLLVIVAAMAGFYYNTIRPAMKPTAPRLTRKMMEDFRPDITLPSIAIPEVNMPDIRIPPPVILPPMVISGDRLPLESVAQEVPLPNQATLDFSTGAPSIRSQGDDQAAMDKAIREMNEAVKDITFDGQK